MKIMQIVNGPTQNWQTIYYLLFLYVKIVYCSKDSFYLQKTLEGGREGGGKGEERDWQS